MSHISHTDSLFAFPYTGHVHLIPVEHIKLVVIKYVGPTAKDLWRVLSHWPVDNK